MKTMKTVAVMAALALILSVCAPALAVWNDAEALARITLLIKEKLDIGDGYDSFESGSDDSGSVKVWNLYWYSGDEEVSVTCGEDGTVYSYSVYDYAEGYTQGDDTPRFPSITYDDAAKAAEAFGKKVLGPSEGVLLSGSSVYDYLTEQQSYYCGGYLTNDGVRTENYVSFTVRCKDLTVTGYWRGDTSAVYHAPLFTQPAIDEEAARAALRKVYGLELRYELTDDVYRPVYSALYDGEYLVNAATGEVYNRSDAYNGAKGVPYYMDSLSSNENADATAAGAHLTDTEQAGIALMAGALPVEQLDAAVRAVTPFGIDADYTYSGADYSTDGEGGVTAVLYYLSTMEINGTTYNIQKVVTLNALDGSLLSMYTDYPWYNGVYSDTLNTDTARTAASDFLSVYAPELFAETQLTDSVDSSWNPYVHTVTSTYTRIVNGIPMTDNTVSVTVNTDDGTVDSYWYYWTENPNVEPLGEVISPDAAADAFAAARTLMLFYANIPADIDSDWNVTAYDTVLSYGPDGESQSVYGVDAHTGEALSYSYSAGEYVYGDLEGCAQRDQIETLALYGIGFAGGSFLPDAETTERDALRLLLKACGYWLEDDQDDASLYDLAAGEGFSFTGNADAAVSRAALARAMVILGGYKKAAALSGIYLSGFADDAQIDPADYSYIAIAKALGFAQADANGAFNPNGAVTRAQAAEMLYLFLSRAD